MAPKKVSVLPLNITTNINELSLIIFRNFIVFLNNINLNFVKETV